MITLVLSSNGSKVGENLEERSLDHRSGLCGEFYRLEPGLKFRAGEGAVRRGRVQGDDVSRVLHTMICWC